MSAGGQILVGEINFGTGAAEFKGLVRVGGSRATALRIVHQGQIVGVDIIEQRAGALVEHIGVDVVGLEQRNAPLPLRVLDA